MDPLLSSSAVDRFTEDQEQEISRWLGVLYFESSASSQIMPNRKRKKRRNHRQNAFRMTNSRQEILQRETQFQDQLTIEQVSRGPRPTTRVFRLVNEALEHALLLVLVCVVASLHFFLVTPYLSRQPIPIRALVHVLIFGFCFLLMCDVFEKCLDRAAALIMRFVRVRIPR